jgi:methoxymalonate biosynthesis acyl carrier protein
MPDESIPVRLAHVLAEQLAIEAPAADFDLFESGLVDSLSFAQLLVALEKEFEIRFAVDDIDLDRFRTLQAITEVVTRALAAAEPVAGP